MNEFVRETTFAILDEIQKYTYQQKLGVAKKTINDILATIAFCASQGAIDGNKDLEDKYFPKNDKNYLEKTLCSNLFGLCFTCDGPANFKEKQMAQEIVTSLGLNVSVDSLLKLEGADGLQAIGEMFMDIGIIVDKCKDVGFKNTMHQMFHEKMIKKLFPPLMAIMFYADGHISDMDYKIMYTYLAIFVYGVDD